MDWQLKAFNELSLRELYNILMVRTNVFVVEQECPYDECDGRDTQAFHLYRKKGDNIIAYLRILPPGLSYEEASVGRVLVTKDERGKGMGQEMMKAAMDFIKEDMAQTSIRISAQEYLKDFYEGLGFVTVSDIYLEDDIPHIEMLYTE